MRVLAIVLLAAACGGKTQGIKDPCADPCADPCKAGEPVTAPATNEVVTLVNLENGDRACYVYFQREDGTEVSFEGDFTLCPNNERDASTLIGAKVTYRTEKANVLAASCEGDIDCGESDEVDLVVEINAAE